MTTVTSKMSGRKYEVRDTLYGTSNLIYSLYYGNICVAVTKGASQCPGPITIEEAVIAADARVEELGIEIHEG